MKFDGDARLEPKTVVVEGGKNEMVHAPARPKIAVQSHLDALADESSREHLPWSPESILRVLFDTGCEIIPLGNIVGLLFGRHGG
jgi:hypothetical protein